MYEDNDIYALQTNDGTAIINGLGQVVLIRGLVKAVGEAKRLTETMGQFIRVTAPDLK